MVTYTMLRRRKRKRSNELEALQTRVETLEKKVESLVMRSDVHNGALMQLMKDTPISD